MQGQLLLDIYVLPCVNRLSVKKKCRSNKFVMSCMLNLPLEDLVYLET